MNNNTWDKGRGGGICHKQVRYQHLHIPGDALLENAVKATHTQHTAVEMEVCTLLPLLHISRWYTGGKNKNVLRSPGFTWRFLLCCRVPAGPMTLTRGSFSYSNGEEYHGEWKEGKTDLQHSPVHPPSTRPQLHACFLMPLTPECM